MLPQYTTPLKAGIRTTEGILTAIIGTLITISSWIDPSSLPHKWAAGLLTVLGVLYGLQRVLVKVVALQKGIGIDAPIANKQLDQLLASITDQAAAVENMANTHSDLLQHLNVLASNPMQTQVFPQSAESAQPDPVDIAVAEVKPADEAAVQPPPEPDYAEPVPGAPPAVPSASATIPPPIQPPEG